MPQGNQEREMGLWESHAAFAVGQGKIEMWPWEIIVSSHTAAYVTCWVEEPGCGPRGCLTLWLTYAGAKATGRFSCATWKWKGLQRLPSHNPLPHSPKGRLTCPRPPGLVQGWPMAQPPIAQPRALPVAFKDVSLALKGKGLYQEWLREPRQNQEQPKVSWESRTWLGLF